MPKLSCLSVATGLWAALTVTVLGCAVLPVAPNVAVFTVSVLAATYNPFLLVLAVPGAVLLVSAARARRRVATVLTAVLTLAVVAGVVVPTSRLARTAAEQDVHLSLSQLFRGPSGGLTQPTTTTAYTHVDGRDLLMDVWQPTNQTTASQAALVYVYGGGFSSGDRKSRTDWFQHLTSQGITVFAMDYRLSTPTHPSFDEAAPDVVCAVGWVHQHADEFRIDPDRIAISGGSAGGNLAMLAAYSAGARAIAPSCEVQDTSVAAVIDFYGPPDLTQLYDETPSTPVQGSLEQYLGGSPDAVPDRYSALSPTTYLEADAPPTLIVQGLHDTGVPPATGTDLAERLEELGVPHELLLLPDTQHGFDGYFGGLANQIAQARVSEFLREHLTG